MFDPLVNKTMPAGLIQWNYVFGTVALFVEGYNTVLYATYTIHRKNYVHGPYLCGAFHCSFMPVNFTLSPRTVSLASHW